MQVPQALLQSLQQLESFDQKAFEEVHAAEAQLTSIRLNKLKPCELNKDWEKKPIPWCPSAYYLQERPSFTFDPLFHAGAYYVQEASSMFLWEAMRQLAGPDTGKTVLDLCAAPGGKSTLLAAYYENGLIVSNEVIKSRAGILVENITKWGTGQVVVTNNDPAHFQSLPGFFDLMVVDAPCSGSGLFRKDPHAVKEWSEENVLHCSKRQQRILTDALPALKEEGILVYATCSYSIEEDEAIADWLVAEMELVSIQLQIQKEWGIVETCSSDQRAFGYRFYPDKVKGEGFFLAAFRNTRKAEQRKLKDHVLVIPDKRELTAIQDFSGIPAGHHFFKQADTIRAVKTEWVPAIRSLAGCLYIKKAGTAIGTIKGRDIIPAHEFALSAIVKGHFPEIHLNLEQALQYLKRKELAISGAKMGWNLVFYGGLPLGWVKILPNRLNNYYPAEWRILKE
ncbi:MAG: hypothetical protein RLZZ28_1034 [Bacteroidota bacterium]|jgi:16S rRNA C967 or C1407 C5-methylase (RsmB/RsmF family)/NOL1/NOP2/fmu family ribosome biogenesis protein